MIFKCGGDDVRYAAVVGFPEKFGMVEEFPLGRLFPVSDGEFVTARGRTLRVRAPDAPRVVYIYTVVEI